MDKIFIVEMLKKYSKHLYNVTTSIEYTIADYDRQLDSLKNLDQKRYGQRVRELENKKTEAFTKLSHVCPNIKKMDEQIIIIEK